MFLFGKLKKKKVVKEPEYPEIAASMKTAMEIASEIHVTRDKQLEAERQGRKDMAVVHKARFEALLWVLGKEYATAVVR